MGKGRIEEIKKGTQKRIRENGNINYQVRGKV